MASAVSSTAATPVFDVKTPEFQELINQKAIGIVQKIMVLIIANRQLAPEALGQKFALQSPISESDEKTKQIFAELFSRTNFIIGEMPQAGPVKTVMTMMSEAVGIAFLSKLVKDGTDELILNKALAPTKTLMNVQV